MLQKRSSQPSICTPSPMIRSIAGLEGSPKVSYSSSMPLVCARGTPRSLPGASGQVDPVDLAVLLRQVAHVGSDLDRAPGRAAHDLGGLELASVPVHVLAQPVPQRLELAALDARLQVGDVAVHRLPQLPRDHV